MPRAGCGSSWPRRTRSASAWKRSSRSYRARRSRPSTSSARMQSAPRPWHCPAGRGNPTGPTRAAGRRAHRAHRGTVGARGPGRALWPLAPPSSGGAVAVGLRGAHGVPAWQYEDPNTNVAGTRSCARTTTSCRRCWRTRNACWRKRSSAPRHADLRLELPASRWGGAAERMLGRCASAQLVDELQGRVEVLTQEKAQLLKEARHAQLVERALYPARAHRPISPTSWLQGPRPLPRTPRGAPLQPLGSYRWP